jgi:hypothetical protein
MRKQYTVAIAATLTLLCQQGGALAEENPTSANYVMSGCRDIANRTQSEYLRYGLCVGVVRAILYFGSANFGICFPAGATVGQAIKVVTLYIDQRPARMHEQFEDLALEALQQAWPCRR